MHTHDFCLNSELFIVLSWMLADVEHINYGMSGIAMAWQHPYDDHMSCYVTDDAFSL